MQTDLYNQKGEKSGKVELAERVFSCPWNADLVHQALRVQTINQIRPWAHVKDRGEVRGGGKKPWRQKGTGRARHGSIRSPIWKGGGVTHGPNNKKVFSLKINKKMRQKAMFCVLSRRFNEGEVKIFENIKIDEPKTGLLVKWLKDASINQSVLIIVDPENKNLFRAVSNVSKATVVDPRSLNVYDLLRPATILIEKNALDLINEHYHAGR
ncbi:MAG: 50S ribosomal protein L4 [Candidatus Colwellbacteria bacterium CG10_big_fil_rev_8_21_14_0_10_42_22]|uniref:Large ribosomal subunit protein uL4 n=1 Tax=Candidatus Colwellbacteria bacterium CG10_big_fil_rev_8_21_14_0_10_42_22 TaxID=1974540 RepID=A0A2H0VFA9_9BACT|nr:MAG: 50S ribosomal protein L4 [Candidatus Colwellbacteria bacterium CG10_big_fil_rev_8_21_14_0_10_42_22]